MFNKIFKRGSTEVVVDTPQEVLDSKKELQTASDAAVTNTNKIKGLLMADHITFRIHKATHEVKHG